MKKALALALTLIMMLSLAACGSSSSSSDIFSSSGDPKGGDAVIEWTMCTTMSSTSLNVELWNQFSEKLKETTDGRLVLTVLSNGQHPYNSGDTVSCLADNITQLADLSTGSVTGDMPILKVIGGLPFLVTTPEEFDIIDEAVRPYLNPTFEKFNAKVVFRYNMPQQYIHGAGSEINSLEDLHGKKIRVYEEGMQNFLNHSNITAVSMSLGDVPSSLQTNAINGIMTSSTSICDYQLYYNLDWTYMNPLSIASNYIVCNQEAFAALPADVQESFLKCCEEFEPIMRETILNNGEEAFNEMLENNMVLIEATEESKAADLELAQQFWDIWAAGEKEEIVEAYHVIREVLGK